MQQMLKWAGLDESLCEGVPFATMSSSDASMYLLNQLSLKRGHARKFMRLVWPSISSSVDASCIDSPSEGTTRSGGSDLDSWISILLPGGDGSVLHFKGLAAFLKVLRVQVLEFDIAKFESIDL
jgi:hypothetical protein